MAVFRVRAEPEGKRGEIKLRISILRAEDAAAEFFEVGTLYVSYPEQLLDREIVDQADQAILGFIDAFEKRGLESRGSAIAVSLNAKEYAG